MANIKALKKAADKGSPPTATTDNLAKAPRDTAEPKGKMEFSVPENVRDEFAQEAGKRFGFKKGAKSEMFLAMWEEYKSRIS